MKTLANLDRSALSLRRESLCGAGLVGVVALAQGWLSRWQVNPDGVAYLDLADALRNGAWADVVQGYWSPLYPALLAIASALGSVVRSPLLPTAHLLNAAIVVLGAVVLHRFIAAHIATVMGIQRWWIRGVWLTYAVGSLQLTRGSALTPDQLLLVILVVVSLELLRHDEPRPVRLGLLLGAAYLAKTSIWPWLIVALVLLAVPRVMQLKRGSLPRLLAGSLAVVASWMGAMSWRYQQLTPGSTAALNSCWYLRACDSRTPDTHSGQHERYRTINTRSGSAVSFATFQGAHWTYQPWSDPTSWDAGVTTRTENALVIGPYIAFVFNNLLITLRDALRYFMLGPVLLAAWAVIDTRRRGLTRERWDGRETRGRALAVFGVVGVLQFAFVHVEPRLIAPFATMFGIGLYATLLPPLGNREAKANHQRPPVDAKSTWVTWKLGSGVSALWVVLTAGAIWYDMRDDIRVGSAIGVAQQALLGQARATLNGTAPKRLAIVGEALSLSTYARALDLRIVAQVLPRSAAVIDALPGPEQLATLKSIVGANADLAWRLRPDGSVAMVSLR